VQTTAPQVEALNQRAYRGVEVAAHYAALKTLTPSERLLFRTYLTPGMKILDLGVGGGRTTSYLSKIASRYVGVDYSEAMLGACRSRFPHLEFLLADASDLSIFPDASFDAIVFSFNGLDYVVPDANRLRCLDECRRVLRPQGTLIFSSHNPRSVVVRPALDRGRVRAFARRFISQRHARFPWVVGAVTASKAVEAILRAAVGSVSRMVRRIPSSAFWNGEGDLFDPADGGLVTHCWIPSRVVAELDKFDFQLIRCLGNDYPRVRHGFITDWYYYVFLKRETGSMKEELCA
jgi:ubiquinone/menaquinone biosynthesis C-methylase UbiE